MPEAKIEGAVVIAYLKARGKGAQAGPTLARPELVNLGGRMFLAGSLITSSGHWAEGRRAFFAVDEIESMIEFETKEAYDDKMSGSRPRRHRRLWGR